MPTPTEIDIFMIAKTQVDRDEVKRWMDRVGAAEFEIPSEEQVTDPALLIALAAKNCYRSFEVGLNPNVTRIRKDYVEYLDNVLASGHGSVCEHSTYSFAIEGITRVATAELNRHRAGWAISECSFRFVRFDKDPIPYWVPLSILGGDVLSESALKDIVDSAVEAQATGNETKETFSELDLETKKQLTRDIFRRSFATQELFYRLLESIWATELSPESQFKAKKEITSMMRRIIGMGVATGGVWTGNIRALRHVLAMRCSPAAEEEICHIFSRIAEMMKENEPMLFGDFHQDEQGFWKPKYVKV